MPARTASINGINAWTVLVGIVTIIVFVMVRRRWPSSPSKLIGLAAGTVVAAVITLAIHADVGPARSVPRQDSAARCAAAAVRSDGIALALRFGYDLLITALAIAVVGSLDSLLAAVGEADGPLDTAHHPTGS
jgi:MFS superfamily sulfate permease-like transporter